MTAPDGEPSLSVRLTVGPGRPMGDRPTLLVTARVRNDSDGVVDTRISSSVLRVDGEAWPGWSLAIGNGTIDESLTALPPHQEATVAHELAAASLPDHAVLQLEVLGRTSNPVTLGS